MDAIADTPPPQCVGLGPLELMETLAQPAREMMETAQVLLFCSSFVNKWTAVGHVTQMSTARLPESTCFPFAEPVLSTVCDVRSKSSSANCRLRW